MSKSVLNSESLEPNKTRMQSSFSKRTLMSEEISRNKAILINITAVEGFFVFVKKTVNTA